MPGPGRVAAVMLLLHQYRDDDVRLVLTRRNARLKRHAGQISFPGGRQESGESLVETALRESREEIGIETEAVDILGGLATVYIPPSDYTIHPFVGWYHGLPRFRREQQEVSEIISAPVRELLLEGNPRFGRIDSENLDFETDYYAIAGCQVWGATAIVMHEFAERIRAAGQAD